MKNPQLPAGLANKSVEVYVKNDELKALYNGDILPFIELPDKIIEVFEVELINDKKAFDAIQSVFQINESNEILEQFVKCRFGGFDNVPDLINNKLKTNSEYWDCGFKGKCEAEGKVCLMPHGMNGRLSPRETQLVRLVSKGLADKQIALEMNISINSVITYQKRVREKIGAYSRIDIMRFAVNNNLLY